jgi:hypothetical protein
MRENSDFATKINEINVELSGNSQRYINECCESESDGKIDAFGAGCCKRRGGVAVAMWCVYATCASSFHPHSVSFRISRVSGAVILLKSLINLL